MDIRQTLLPGLTLALTVVLAACAPVEPASPPADGAELLGTAWELVSLKGAAAIEGKPVTLRFGETSIEGSGGCNTYGGSYMASGNSLSLEGLYWTEMACIEPAGIMDQEQAYFRALDAGASYRADRGRLEVFDEAGAQILAFDTADG